MPSLIEFLKELFSTKAAFSGLEAAIFDAVKFQLSSEASELWAKQLHAVNKLHRSPDGKEVNLYVVYNGKAEFPQEICFSRRAEFKVAVVDLKAQASDATLRARVWCVEGHVFSIEYKTPFTVFEKLSKGKWQVSCHIENHPM